MKTTKFSYYVCDYDSFSLVPSDSSVVAKFPTLAMARNFCMFNRGHYYIYCAGFVEYKDGLEVHK